ncbi:glucosamine inositolphosphorylceramide transferase family protein [Pedobacter sp.]
MLSAFKSILTNVKKNIYELVFIEQWQLRYRFVDNVSNVIDTDFKSYHKIIPPRDRFWADPFVVAKEDKLYFFIEELEYRDGKGYIAVIEFDQNSQKQVSHKIIEQSYHLSYPFIFECAGSYYMIPESTSNRTIELYWCEDFPFKWSYQSTLMHNVNAADTTIIYHNAKYWMFTLIESQESEKRNADLHIFYCDDILSDKWMAHAANPVLVDVGSARPAGNIFERDGVLYRPSQDCSKRYGWALVINKIVTLNEEEYVEELIQHLPPNWERGLLATHTINTMKELTVIDVLVKRRRF